MTHRVQVATAGDFAVSRLGVNPLAQRMPLMGRTAQTGQPLQSRLLSAALVGDLMSLAFLLHRQWQPYPKWREAMFARLPCAGELAGPLQAAAAAGDWRDRETALAAAIEVLAGAQRRRGLPTPDEAVTSYWDRPYRTVPDAVPDQLRAAISDPGLAGLAAVAGNVEQWVDSVELLAKPVDGAVLTCAYRAWLEQAAGPG